MKRTLGLFLAASAACLSGALFLGASSKVGVEHKEALWAADSFAQLGQAGFVATLIWVGLSLADLRQGPASGPTRLVDVLARRYSPKFDRDIDPFTEIGVVGGATNAIFSALVALGDPDDEV